MTKVYGPMGDRLNDVGLSARRIRQACDASLRRLQTAYDSARDAARSYVNLGIRQMT